MLFSVIIAYHNEGQEMINDTIKSVRDTTDPNDYEIIVVDDHSTEPIDLPGVRLIRHPQRRGLGAAFDTGKAAAKADNLIIMCADTRAIDPGWMNIMAKALDDNPKSIICTRCVNLSPKQVNGLDPLKRRTNPKLVYSGANIKPYVWEKNTPPNRPRPKTIINAVWRPQDNSTTGIIDIPCVLGAFYGIKKAWYEHLDGFCGHKVWGTLDPYISLKSWMFGGSCKLCREIDTGHIFNRDPKHGIPQPAVLHNKIWVASVLFDPEISAQLISHIPSGHNLSQAHNMIDRALLTQKRAEYKQKTVRSLQELEQLLGVKFSLDTTGVRKLVYSKSQATAPAYKQQSWPVASGSPKKGTKLR